MSDPHESGLAKPSRAEADQIGSLLRLAGPREAVPEERMHRVKAAVYAEWRQQPRARSPRVTIAWSMAALAAAALILLGVRLVFRADGTAPIARPELATIEALTGVVHLLAPPEPAGGGGDQPSGLSSFRIGDRVRAGDAVDTTGGGLAGLRLADGASVRVDRGTRVRLVSDTILILISGAVYVDSGNEPGARALEVRTPWGIARDIGTRFEVRINGSALRVRVRDGLVRLSQDRQSHDAKPGEELTLNANGSVVRRSVPVFGAEWAWAFALARPFDLEGRSLRDFLDWITSENGWRLRFADSAVEQKSLTTILHGSILGLTANEALSAVLSTSGVEHSLEDGVLLIQPSATGAKD